MEKEFEIFDFDLDKDNDPRKHLVVVTYDIPDNKRRSKMAKLLQGYGIRVQRSVFECVLAEKLYFKLIKEIEKLVVESEDLLRIYRLSGITEIKTYGNIGLTQFDDEVYVV